eukprot:55211-Pyramimonas_sp.AAC.1
MPCWSCCAVLALPRRAGLAVPCWSFFSIGFWMSDLEDESDGEVVITGCREQPDGGDNAGTVDAGTVQPPFHADIIRPPP